MGDYTHAVVLSLFVCVLVPVGLTMSSQKHPSVPDIHSSEFAIPIVMPMAYVGKKYADPLVRVCEYCTSKYTTLTHTHTHKPTHLYTQKTTSIVDPNCTVHRMVYGCNMDVFVLSYLETSTTCLQKIQIVSRINLRITIWSGFIKWIVNYTFSFFKIWM